MRALFLILTFVAISSAPYLVNAQERASGAKLKKEASTGGVELQIEKPAAAPGLHLEKPVAAPAGKLKTFSLKATNKHIVFDEKTVNGLKKSTNNDAIFSAANSALADHNLKVAGELYQLLSQRDPKKAAYFYGAGYVEYHQGDYAGAFANFVVAWHLSENLSKAENTEYGGAAQVAVQALQSKVDPLFRLTWGYNVEDPEVVLNAATRLWKSGFTKESVQLNEYALKNSPNYAQIAAYNLGATAEYQKEYKQALQYYQLAAQTRQQLEAEHDPKPVAISKSLNELSAMDIEQAISDTEKALKGNAVVWHGWTQATRYPEVGGSEICPNCAISRTQARYYNP